MPDEVNKPTDLAEPFILPSNKPKDVSNTNIIIQELYKVNRLTLFCFVINKLWRITRLGIVAQK